MPSPMSFDIVQYPFLFYLVPWGGFLILGFGLGWLWAKGRWQLAVIMLPVGVITVLAAYSTLFVGVFDIKSEIHSAPDRTAAPSH
jgi:hypothetical protein